MIRDCTVSSNYFTHNCHYGVTDGERERGRVSIPLVIKRGHLAVVWRALELLKSRLHAGMHEAKAWYMLRWRPDIPVSAMIRTREATRAVVKLGHAKRFILCPAGFLSACQTRHSLAGKGLIKAAYPSWDEGVGFAAQQQPDDVLPGVAGSVVEGRSPILQGQTHS